MTQNSTIQWQTGTPKETGKYLITFKYLDEFHVVDVDRWCGVPDNYGDHWEKHYDVNVIAWCKIEDIKPFKF
jgi:hypothetical protein